MYWASGHVEWGVEDINPTYVWHENGNVECDGPTALLAPGILHKCPGIPQTKPHIRKISDMLLTKTEYIERKDLYICRLCYLNFCYPLSEKILNCLSQLIKEKDLKLFFVFGSGTSLTESVKSPNWEIFKAGDVGAQNCSWCRIRTIFQWTLGAVGLQYVPYWFKNL